MSTWGIHTSGAATNGGGFRGDATFAEAHSSGAPVLSTTTAIFTTATKTITGLSGAADATMENVHVYLNHASEPETYEHYVASFTDSSTIVLDAIPAGWDADLTNVTIKIGGFFSSIEDLVATGADVINDGDIVQWVDGMTDSLTGNLTLSGSAAGNEILYESVDSSGVSVDAQRAVQGSDSQKSGQLVKTAMSEINTGTLYQIITGAHNTFNSLHIHGSIGDYIVDNNSTNNAHFFNCAIINTGSGTASRVALLNDSVIFSNCDLISESTSLTGFMIDLDNTRYFGGCYLESKSSDSGLIMLNQSSGFGNQIKHCIIVGSGGGTAIRMSPQASLSYPADFSFNTFYNFNECVKVTSIASTGSSVTLVGNLVVDCTTFILNTQSTNFRLLAYDNCLPPTGTMTEANRYNGNLVGIFGSNDTISTNNAAATFETAGSDFRLKTGIDALGTASFGADAGAVRNLGTGGGGGGAASHGTMSGGMQ